MSKLISTFKISFDDDTKAEIAALKDSLDAVSNRLKAGNMLPTGGLLAANDVAEPDLKQLGQWVFEGQDEKWVSAHVDKGGSGYYSSLKKSELEAKEKHWGNRWGDVGDFTKLIGFNFDATNWRNSAIDRETINDVDYLSNLDECVPHIDDAVDQSDWLSESVPQITQADMQIIFIKNLSEVLVQRMHSMGRFSDDGYHIGGDKLMPWDIVIDRFGKVGVLTGLNKDKSNFTFCFFCQDSWLFQNTVTVSFTAANVSSREVCAITETQLKDFRAALEACYA